jgi:hypothetical protein
MIQNEISSLPTTIGERVMIQRIKEKLWNLKIRYLPIDNQNARHYPRFSNELNDPSNHHFFDQLVLEEH